MNAIKSALFGLATGDALGVPVEFKTRELLKVNPITDMVGHGTHDVPPGTWSDDSSLAFCLAESLLNGLHLPSIGKSFVRWYHENYWTPYGTVFDIGITTREAIQRLANGREPVFAGGFGESENGNGSLMRILPLLFYQLDKKIEERYESTRAVSSITHGHIRSVIACFYYLEFARLLLVEKDKWEVYSRLQRILPPLLKHLDINPAEIKLFDRLLDGDISIEWESGIRSSGYVLHTLESSVWCLLTTENYESAVLKAVNLGGDTDTTAAVTGGLAGILYGFDQIPTKWVNQLARKEDIDELASRLSATYGENLTL
jgi:ADP-ribosyl-[dinitrogen reductase] hydrolase